ncbi:hypothetical protein FACS1894105_14100 [Clostridia bacterium]|nr:hypothetical protein FACS1894105_14100 [Clostridia bacterium]
MKISISSINIAPRIRKDVTKIPELAADIRKNGLICPIAVMAVGESEYQLLAGLRRLEAVKYLGDSDIEAIVTNIKDAEEMLHIEISENEQRENFTLADKLDYAALLKKIESEKASERKFSGKVISDSDLSVQAREGVRNRTDSIVGNKIGMTESSFRYADYLANNAPEYIGKIDSGEIKLRTAFDIVRAAEKEAAVGQNISEIVPAETTSVTTKQATSNPHSNKKPPLTADMIKIQRESNENSRIHKEFDALTPEGKIDDLKRQLKEERTRAVTAEFELFSLKDLRHNDVLHDNSIIDNLKMQLANLESLLAVANTRITELEAITNVHTD